MNKKGIFIPLTVILFIVVMGYILLTLPYVETKTIGSIGETSLAILNTQTEAEGIHLYLNLAIKQTTNQAFSELAKNGGYFELKPECSYNGYGIWNKNCNFDAKTNFLKIFDKLLYEKLIKFPPGSFLAYLASRTGNTKYEYELNEEFKGTAKERIPIYIVGPTKKETHWLFWQYDVPGKDYGKYYINPSFKQPFEYNFEDFSFLKNEIEKCKQKGKMNLRDFIECDTLKDICKRDGEFLICEYDTKHIYEEKPIKIRFALDFRF